MVTMITEDMKRPRRTRAWVLGSRPTMAPQALCDLGQAALPLGAAFLPRPFTQQDEDT